jgi:hypothetical protein
VTPAMLDNREKFQQILDKRKVPCFQQILESREKLQKCMT